jgi:thymidylate kinase
VYKVVLTDQASDPSKGYFNIADSSSNKLGKYYSLTANKGEPRTHLHDYLRKLLGDADEVVICDRYFDGVPQNNINNSIKRNCINKGSEKVFTLFPSHSVNVFLEVDQNPTRAQSTKISDNCIQHVHTTYANIVLCSSIQKNYEDHHDRYLLIDNKIEVIITSGIDYLFDTTKECTIIVRQV